MVKKKFNPVTDLPDPDEAERIDPKFASAYRRMSRKGHCDAWGGMESRRVYKQWVESGRPTSIARFIRQEANV